MLEHVDISIFKLTYGVSGPAICSITFWNLFCFTQSHFSHEIILQYISQFTGSNIFLSEAEFEDLCRACGLIDFKFVRNGFYIMFSATKAS
jgi:hypothetical protein